jgi:hypothetical protein
MLSIITSRGLLGGGIWWGGEEKPAPQEAAKPAEQQEEQKKPEQPTEEQEKAKKEKEEKKAKQKEEEKKAAAAWKMHEPFELTGVAPAPELLKERIGRGVDYIISQRKEGGFWNPDQKGGALEGLADMIMNSTVTTSFCVMALRSQRDVDPQKIDPIVREGVDFVLKKAQENAAGKKGDWFGARNHRIWTFMWATRMLADATRWSELGIPHTVLAEAADSFLNYKHEGLSKLQLKSGGWEYGEDMDDFMTFATSAACHAMLDAQRAGFRIPQADLSIGIKRLKLGKMPEGTFCYRYGSMGSGAEKPEGSMGRICACESVFYLSGHGSYENLQAAVEMFFKYRGELDKVRGAPSTHYPPYQNAAYYYMFGHYFCARSLRYMEPAFRAKWKPYLQEVMLKVQDQDGTAEKGTWSDHPAFGHLYATCMALMILRELE